jgi:hypothetical protein
MFPQPKPIGKAQRSEQQGFSMNNKQNVSRRDFMKWSSIAGGAVATAAVSKVAMAGPCRGA